MIFSLIVSFYVALSFGSKTYRHDSTGVIQSLEAYWGSFSPYTYCNNGKFAKGFKLKVEPNQGSGDDTSANGFQLICDDGEVLSAGNDKPWGTYSTRSCSSGAYIKGFRTKVETAGMCGSGCDDTALNSVRAYCTNYDEIAINTGGWGIWGDADFCKPGSLVCGFRQRCETCSDCDDTALNAVQLACCASPTIYSGAEGYWEPVVRGNPGLEFSREVTIGITDYAEDSWSSTNTESLEVAISASMSFTYAGVGGEVSTSLTSSASSSITSGSLSSVTQSITEKFTMGCKDGYNALYQYVTSVKESGQNRNADTFEIRATDYWCSVSGKPPKCPYLYCKTGYGDVDCQTCESGLFS